MLDSNIIEVNMGHLYVAQAPTILSTGGIGSCLAVCLFSPSTKWGGLAHVMLPKRLSPDGQITEEDLRFADVAIQVMIEQFERSGIPKSNVIAKIVGGASMFPEIQGRSNQVGIRNIEAVTEFLQQNGIKIVAQEVGGNVGRAITFDLTTGIVNVKMSL